MPSGSACHHVALVVDSAPEGIGGGYRRPEWSRRVAATTPLGRFPKDAPKQETETHKWAFPAPLALAEDELSFDPAYPPQSLRSWASLRERNKVTRERKMVYVARPPIIPQDMSYMVGWATPDKKCAAQPTVQPRFEDIVDYLHAFYHGLQVKAYDPDLCFQPWDSPRSKAKKRPNPSAIALQQAPSPSCTRIRVRPSPDGLFPYQLNLSDLLDVTIQLLPDDAYAILLIVHQDLYEDDLDDFCCGRAYGGSRVAVVSSARYNPVLHATHDVDREHMCPASHCLEYLSRLRHGPENIVATTFADESAMSSSTNPLPKAVLAFQAASPSSEPGYSYGLWLFCVARTAPHELGHCFGMDHYVYYACVMQVTASVAEDCRQPPYLCPVCATKRARAVREVSVTPDFDEK